MGEVTTAPSAIQVKEPTTDKVFKDHVRIYWDATAPYAVIYYQLQDDSGRTLEDEFVKLEGADFISFVTGFTNDLKNRAEAAIWADIQSKYTVV